MSPTSNSPQANSPARPLAGAAARRNSRPQQFVVALLSAVLTVATLPAQQAFAVDDWQQTVEITFPTDPRASLSDTYTACRSGCARVHQAADLMGQKMWPLYAATDGQICSINDESQEDSYGRSITLCGNDGNRYRYLHLNNDTPGTDDGQGALSDVYGPGIARGSRVAAGQLIAFMGDSGNAEASAPHLHLDLYVPGVTNPYGEERINPYHSLMAALAAGRISDGTAVLRENTGRLAGKNRVTTAIAIAAATYTQASTVIVASSQVAHDALVSGPLAAVVGGPVLLSDPQLLDTDTVAAIQGLGATTVILVGESRRLAEQVRVVLGDVTVELVGSDDRFATSAAVAELVWAATDATFTVLEGATGSGSTTEPGQPAARRAILAKGQDPDTYRAWPDALSASWYGAARRLPVLLTSSTGLPQATAAALAGVREVVIAGGPGAISTEQIAQVEAIIGQSTQRLSGTDRYQTAAAIAGDLASRGLAGSSTVHLATGTNWPDAVSAGAAVARQGGMLLLVDEAGASLAVRDAVRPIAAEIDKVVALGGLKAVTVAALDNVALWAL